MGLIIVLKDTEGEDQFHTRAELAFFLLLQGSGFLSCSWPLGVAACSLLTLLASSSHRHPLLASVFNPLHAHSNIPILQNHQHLISLVISNPAHPSHLPPDPNSSESQEIDPSPLQQLISKIREPHRHRMIGKLASSQLPFHPIEIL